MHLNQDPSTVRFIDLLNRDHSTNLDFTLKPPIQEENELI